MKIPERTHVHIIAKVKMFSEGKNIVKTRRKPGFLLRYDEEEAAYGWVAYHGRPHHFTSPGCSYGTYIEKFPLKALEERKPERGDPLEF